MSDTRFWLGFSLLPGIGGGRIRQLLSHFPTLADAWSAPEAELKRSGLSDKIAANIVESRREVDLDAEMARLEQFKAWLLRLDDPRYPETLRHVDDAPPLLYVRGTLEEADARALAVVGTRKATKHGRDVTYELCRRLAENGLTIVSGLAHGIDTAAHNGALDGGGRTIAVLGNGVDKAYPQENRDLARRIVSSGAVISEFPIGTPPHGKNFPRRNRIISGLSLGVLVAEAPIASGAIITAELALEQGREVFALPGSITNKMAAGTNRLIQDGAKLVMDERDILDELNIRHEKRQTRAHTEQVAPANDKESAVLALLGAEPIHIDEIIRMSGLSVAEVTSTLTVLELKGLAEMTGHMQYSRTQSIS